MKYHTGLVAQTKQPVIPRAAERAYTYVMVCRTVMTLLVALAASIAWAQAPYAPAIRQPVQPTPMQPVEETMSDIGPLSASLRFTPSGLRLPVGFQSVYQVPGRPDLFMRVNGALYAVFPQSEYRNGARGLVATIPANTVFYIGGPPGADTSAFRPAQTVDTSAVPQMGEQVRQATEVQSEMRTPPAPARSDANARPNDELARTLAPLDGNDVAPLIYDRGEPMTIVTDSAYRLARIQDLLMRAAEVEHRRSPTSLTESK